MQGEVFDEMLIWFFSVVPCLRGCCKSESYEMKNYLFAQIIEECDGHVLRPQALLSNNGDGDPMMAARLDQQGQRPSRSADLAYQRVMRGWEQLPE
ncbi:hypothetical protein M8C21_021368 [Ambrosia artemisiifolia]|uniref:Uncharacterized protein n=1 Tax=Ambrosia artemisiifolia TaxID=4212 RepID=A0AAD5DBD0_AMBAR|nr:hypothetical protein M8C21_021368 [Ambrosia artemisiifolia]